MFPTALIKKKRILSPQSKCLFFCLIAFNKGLFMDAKELEHVSDRNAPYSPYSCPIIYIY